MRRPRRDRAAAAAALLLLALAPTRAAANAGGAAAPRPESVNPHASGARGYATQDALMALARRAQNAATKEGQKEARQGVGRCTKAKDCPQGRLCAKDGTCKCPVLYSGNANCSAHTKLPPGVSACATPVTSRRVLSKLNSDRKGKYQGLMAIQPFLSHPIKKLAPASFPDLADFSTCAVVASSGGLKKTRPGKDIDAHSAVFRMNDAPTKGYVSVAGSKTTVRVQNKDYLGWNERKSGETCVCYSVRDMLPDPKSSPRTFARWKSCPVKAAISGKAWQYFQTYWRTVGKPKGVRGNAALRVSAGMASLLMAMHLCGEVTAYGFEAGVGHYYRKPGERSNRRRSFSARHLWAAERYCLSQFRRGAVPGVTVV